MARSPLVLVTGSAGRIGKAVVQELLARKHPVRGFDRIPNAYLQDQVIGDITSGADCRKAMAGVGTVIHLAATPDDVDDPVKDLFGPNIIGVHEVFEAAREAGVHRLVLASSGQVVWGHRLGGKAPIGVDVQPTPRYWYAATKMFLEAAGRAFHDKFGISVFAIRVGWCPRPGQEEELASSDWGKNVYLSPGDAGRFFACTVEASAELGFHIFYATSKPLQAWPYDLTPAKKLLGYEPTESWPQGL
jgi:uronate dehydrogenase